MSWASATSPISSVTGPGPRGGGDAERATRRCRRCRWRRGWRARAAAGRRAGKNSSTSRIGIEEATNRVASGGQPLAQPAAPPAARTARRPAPSASAMPGGVVGAAATLEPVRVGGRRRRCVSSAPVAGDLGHDRVGILPGGLRIDARSARARVQPGQPRPQRLGGREVAGADRRPRACSARRTRVAQQQVVGGDRRRAVAGAGQRVGEQRVAEPGGGRRDLRPARALALVASGDDHPAGGKRGAGRGGARRRRVRRHPGPAAGRPRARSGSRGASSTSGSRSGQVEVHRPGPPLQRPSSTPGRRAGGSTAARPRRRPAAARPRRTTSTASP